MQKRRIICLLAWSFLALLALSQAASAYTYPDSTWSSRQSDDWIALLLPLSLFSLITILMIYQLVISTKRRYASGNEAAVSTIIRALISDGESVVSKFGPERKNGASRKGATGGFDWYVTNKRLLVHRNYSDVGVLDFSQISIKASVSSISQLALVMGALFFMVCLFLGILAFVGPVIGSLHTKGPFIYSLALWIIGIEILVVCIVRWNFMGHYQILHPAIGGWEQKKWRIERLRWGGDVEKFINSLHERINSI